MMSLLSQLNTNRALGDLLHKESACIALLTLANRARTLFPNAAAIHLEETDQNDSGELWVQSLYDNRGYIIAGSETFDQAPGAETVAFFLHENNAEVWAPFDATTLKITGRYVFDIDKILATVTRPPQTFRMLDASITHLPEDLRTELDSITGVIADERNYGWFVFVPEDIDETVLEYSIPAPIIALWRAAETHGCQYVLIDTDAPTVPGLTTYDG